MSLNLGITFLSFLDISFSSSLPTSVELIISVPLSFSALISNLFIGYPTNGESSSFFGLEDFDVSEIKLKTVFTFGYVIVFATLVSD